MRGSLHREIPQFHVDAVGLANVRHLTHLPTIALESAVHQVFLHGVEGSPQAGSGILGTIQEQQLRRFRHDIVGLVPADASSSDRELVRLFGRELHGVPAFDRFMHGIHARTELRDNAVRLFDAESRIVAHAEFAHTPRRDHQAVRANHSVHPRQHFETARAIVGIDDVDAREDAATLNTGARILNCNGVAILEFDLVQAEGLRALHPRLGSADLDNAPPVGFHALDHFDRRDEAIAIRAEAVMGSGEGGGNGGRDGVAVEEGESVHAPSIHPQARDASPKTQFPQNFDRRKCLCYKGLRLGPPALI